MNAAAFYNGAVGLSTPLVADELGPYGALTIDCQDWASTEPSFEDLQAKMRPGETFTPLNEGTS